MILTIRTDKPESEVGLFTETGEKLAYETWPAHRQLAETIHLKINETLSLQGWTLKDIEGVVVYGGPGSYTGLRIGISVGNALAYSLGCKIIATSGDDWQHVGIARLQAGKGGEVALPEYDAPARTTLPRK